MDDADFLAKVPIFSLMKRADLERISQQAQRHLFHEGDIIIKENDRDRRLFIILSGEVETVINLGTKKETALGSFGPFSYFGEMSLIDDMVRSASVVAKEDTRVLSLDQWNLHDEINRYPDMAVELLRMLSRRIRDMEKSLINTLGTFLPVCANCKRIRDKNGSWVQIEKYISDHSETKFSHGICPECAKKLYGEIYKEKESE